TPDTCYVVQGNGTVIALKAAAQAPGSQFIASRQTITGGNTRCSPIASLISAQPDVGSGTNLPSLVVADDDGGIFAFGLTPQVINGTNAALPLLWRQFDSASARSAAARPALGHTNGHS